MLLEIYVSILLDSKLCVNVMLSVIDCFPQLAKLFASMVFFSLKNGYVQVSISI